MAQAGPADHYARVRRGLDVQECAVPVGQPGWRRVADPAGHSHPRRREQARSSTVSAAAVCCTVPALRRSGDSYQIPTLCTKVNNGAETCRSTEVAFRYVGESQATTTNDGMNCMNAESPYATCGKNGVANSLAGGVAVRPLLFEPPECCFSSVSRAA